LVVNSEAFRQTFRVIDSSSGDLSRRTSSEEIEGASRFGSFTARNIDNNINIVIGLGFDINTDSIQFTLETLAVSGVLVLVAITVEEFSDQSTDITLTEASEAGSSSDLDGELISSLAGTFSTISWYTERTSSTSRVTAGRGRNARRAAIARDIGRARTSRADWSVAEALSNSVGSTATLRSLATWATLSGVTDGLFTIIANSSFLDTTIEGSFSASLISSWFSITSWWFAINTARSRVVGRLNTGCTCGQSCGVAVSASSQFLVGAGS